MGALYDFNSAAQQEPEGKGSITIESALSNIVARQEEVMATQKSGEAQASPASPEVLSFADLMLQDLPFEEVLAGFVAKGESLVIVAQAGVGKSLMVTDMTLEMAKPELVGASDLDKMLYPRQLWGTFGIPKTWKALVVQSEVSGAALQRRIGRMLDGRADYRAALPNVLIHKVGRDFRYIHHAFPDEAFKNDVRRAVQEHGLEVLVVDPLCSYHGAESENDNAEMRRSLDELTGLQDELGLTVILTHHASTKVAKGQTLQERGASAIRDWAANLMIVQKVPKEPGIFKVSVEKCRNFEAPQDFFLQRGPDLTYRLVEDPQGAKAVQTRNAAVVEVLLALGGQVGKQAEFIGPLCERLNCKPTTAKYAIKQAIADGVINEIAGEGQALGYYVPTEKGAEPATPEPKPVNRSKVKTGQKKVLTKKNK